MQTQVQRPGTEYPPAPPARGLLGHLPALRREQMGFLARCARDYGDFVPLRLGPRRAFLISHPDLIEPVFVASLERFNRGPGSDRNRRMFGSGLVGSDGAVWRRHRQLAQPAFQRERLAAFAPTMVACTERMLATWHEGETRDIHEEMTRLTLEIVVRLLFGTESEAVWREFGARMGAAMRVLPETLLRRLNGPLLLLPEGFPSPTNLRMGRALADLDRIFYPLIRRLRSREARMANADGLLAMLLAARDEDDTGLTDQEIRDELVTFLFAGHETTAAVLTWAFSLLARHPSADARLAEELRRVLGSRLPGAEDRALLVYTEQVVRETLRLYPPAWILGRGVKQACEIGTYRVPAGATVLMSPWALHRDPRYFDAPEQFEPERWAGDLAKRLPRFAYFPFGGGPRLCIGSGFAMLEAALVLATVARRFQFRPSPGHEISIQAAITLRPAGGLPLCVCRR